MRKAEEDDVRLIVLLSSYNGERYLREQLNSLFAQTLGGVEVLVRDDGSADGTPAILAEYAKRGRLRWTAGEHLGPARSFWRLLQCSGAADHYAFCDQDDVWDADKLEIAVRALEAAEDGTPSLYCSDVRVTDAAGRVLSGHLVRREPADYPHALIRNLAPGCTYVFNRAAKELLCGYDAERLGIELHDWTAYQIVACFGRVVFDGTAHMSYRQHGGNAVGAARGSASELLRKAIGFWRGAMRGSRSRQARRLEQAYGSRMSPEARDLTGLFARCRTDAGKKQLLADPRLDLPGLDRFLFRLLVRFDRL